MKWNQKIFLLLGLGLITVISRTQGFFSANYNLNSDQAMFLLMAKRTLAGTEFPLFSWGNRYLGLTEVWLSLPVFSLVGISPEVMVAVMIVIALFTSIILYYSFQFENRVLAIIVVTFFAVGNSYINSLGTDISGNFSATILFLFSGLLFLNVLYEYDWRNIPASWLFGFGVFSGFSFYTRQELALSLIWLFFFIGRGNLYARAKRFFPLVSGFFIGYLPGLSAWYFVPYTKKLIQTKPVLGINPLPGIEYALQSIFPRMEFTHTLYGGMLIVLLSVYGLVRGVREGGKIGKQALYLLMTALTVFFVTAGSNSFNVDRYYLQAIAILTIGNGFGVYYLFEKKGIKILVTVVVFSGLLYRNFQNGKSAFETWRKKPPMMQVAHFLVQKKMFYGMAEYWSSLPVAWFSDDKIHFVTYLGVQRDISGVIRVIRNGVEFYLFPAGTEFAKQGKEQLQKNVGLDGFTTKTISGYIIFILKQKENPWGRDRDILLHELENSYRCCK